MRMDSDDGHQYQGYIHALLQRSPRILSMVGLASFGYEYAS